jgi:hypothetical protein
MGEGERQAGYEWFKRHRCVKGAKKELRYIVRPTAIADAVEAQCTGCGKTKNVTNYACW